jgi:hypothetical protein
MTQAQLRYLIGIVYLTVAVFGLVASLPRIYIGPAAWVGTVLWAVVVAVYVALLIRARRRAGETR